MTEQWVIAICTGKVVWFIGVVAPILFTGRFQPYAILHVVIFLSYIIGDLIAIPFSYVFSFDLSPPPPVEDPDRFYRSGEK